MTRNVGRRPLTPVGLPRQTHGQKRKGKPVEAWKMDLEQDEKSDERRIRGVNLNAIEQIADGVERMMFSWNMDTFERGQERAKILDTLPPACSVGDDEEHSTSDLKEDSCKACTVCHKFPTQQVTTNVTGPTCVLHNMDLSCPRNVRVFGIHQHGENFHTSLSPLVGRGFPGGPNFDHKQDMYSLQALPQRREQISNSSAEYGRSLVDSRVVDVSGHPSVITRQDRMTGGGSVLETRRRDPPGSFQTSTCEKNVGTEGRYSEHSQAMAEYSPRISLWGLTPSPDDDTLPPTPPSLQDCYPVQHDSCPFNLPGFAPADHHLHVSPRKDEARTCHSSPLTHSCPNIIQSRSETDVALGKPTIREAHNCKSRRANSSGLPAYCVSHCSGDYFAQHASRQARAMATQLEVGGRPVTMPVLWNSSEALQNKFESLIHMTSGAPLLQGKERSCSVPPPEISSVEELQLALIECATEYEIKENRNHDEMQACNGVKRLESKVAQQQVKKHVMRPEEMKENVKSPDNQPWKKKERSSPELKKSENGVRAFSRLFDRQRRSLDDALHRVDRLQREVVRKDRELVEWQLKEKETKAQLHGLEDKLKNSRVLQASPKPPEPRKLLIELPALRESLRSLKEEEQKQISSPPQAELAQELSDIKSMSDMSDRDGSINSRLQFLEDRAIEMDELKLTMSKLAANMAELSVAFKDHVQFVNHRLGTIHGLVSQKKLPVKSRNSPELSQPYVPQRNALAQLKLAGLDTIEAEREITRSPRPSPPPSWQR
ncbi:hypothetical protein M758_12G191300 [Ceratodon purpureus]|nr:hypothetical protein M758_12G191300 [Ceratodon purpureus]KAG0599965.1 hypothetical protein M758_12G191300 [Ceratodon purpureus]